MNNTEHITLQDIKDLQRNKRHTFSDYYILRKFSNRITLVLAKTNVTPNQVSFFGFSLYLTATFFFTKNIYYLNVLASVILFFGIVFDCVDGELARAKKISSDFGKWLDTVIDRIGQIIITSGIVIGQYPVLQNRNLEILGYLSIINIALIGLMITLKTKLSLATTKQSLKLSKDLHAGFSEVIMLILILSIFNVLHFVVYVLGTVFLLVWIKSAVEIAKHLTKKIGHR